MFVCDTICVEGSFCDDVESTCWCCCVLDVPAKSIDPPIDSDKYMI